MLEAGWFDYGRHILFTVNMFLLYPLAVWLWIRGRNRHLHSSGIELMQQALCLKHWSRPQAPLQLVHVLDPLAHLYSRLLCGFRGPLPTPSLSHRPGIHAAPQRKNYLQEKTDADFLLSPFLLCAHLFVLDNLSYFRDFNNSIHCKRSGQPYTSLTKLLCGFWYVTFVVQYLSPVINPLFHITLQFLGFHLGYVGRKVGSWPRISHRMSQRSLDLFTGQQEHSKCNRGRWFPNSTCFTWGRTNPIAKCGNDVAWSRPMWVDKEKYANRQLLLQTKCATNMRWWCLLTRN